MIKAIYAGTFDPMTWGHVDIMERAAEFCDPLIVAIAESRGKNPLFSLEEREAFIRERFKNKSIQVVSFSGLLVELTAKYQIHYLIRGIRHEADFVYESQLAAMNRDLNHQLETIWLPARAQFTWVSATLVREIAFLKGDLSRFVPPEVIAAIHQKLKNK